MNEKPWLQYYDKGVPTSLDFPPTPVFTFLEQAALKNPEATCTIFNGAIITYGEMDALTNCLAAGFNSLGIKKGDRVGLFIPNAPQFVIVYFALLKIGAIVVATNPLYTDAEIIHQVNDAGVEFMVLMTNNYEKIKALQARTHIRQIVATNLKETLLPHLKILFTAFQEKKLGFRVELRDNDVWMQDLIEKFLPENRPAVFIGPDDIALLQYSSGTTGQAKGVIATHRMLAANTYQILAWDPRARQTLESVLLAIPLYHAFGMVVGMLYGMMMGVSLVLVPNPRDIKSILEAIQKFRPTFFPGVPMIYNAINNFPAAYKYDLYSINVCISGSAPLLRQTKEKFEALTAGVLSEGYGLSEAPVATHCNPIYNVNKIGSIGLPLPGVDCRIVDPEDGLTELSLGQPGELLIKGPQVMSSYFNRPELTREALRDGWLYTGDMARMDDEGYFYILDRKQDLIKVDGVRVWPREVEEALQKHPAIADAGVAGIPDGMGGGAVKAWVVLKKGQALNMDELGIWAQRNLPPHQCPLHWELVDEIPKTITGKVLRRKLLEAEAMAIA